MFGVDSLELFIVAIAALIFIGPKDLPVAMRTVGRWVGRVRGHARHFTAGIENMMREAELEEMEKKWREENERIMRDYPAALPYPGADLSTGAHAGTPLPEGSMVAEDGYGAPASAPTSNDEPQLPLGPPDNSHRPLP
ncbi:Sec-independent protein translocase protein TatB [uncultured Sphingomonas sp.]|uniref:Sec-independent protein translocase protein TatB n=1 Tax=uncultured Sphingomonas sp. TaxID=158754 RepID=UPI0025DA44C9|nr:Sec-independent protein translocase protein TatB [uncultured Sphingomonas sp.]